MTYDDDYQIKRTPTTFDILLVDDKPDMRNVKYVDPTDHLNCPICKQPFQKPLTTLCGHTFCKECIAECLKSNEKDNIGFCPLDRTPIDSSNIHDLFPTPLLITNMVDDLQVYCLNEDRGCEWVGRRWELEKHLLINCDHTGVVCGGVRPVQDGEGEDEEEEEEEEKDEEEESDHSDQSEETHPKRCLLLVERRCLANSSDTCVHLLKKCDFCEKEVALLREKDHLEKECLLNYLRCEICNNDMIPLCKLEKHKSNCLQSNKFVCPASKIGCRWVGNNAPSLEVHLEKGSCQLNQLLPHFEEMESKISAVKSENEYLKGQINQILANVIHGKITNLGYIEPIEEIGTFTRDLQGHDQFTILNNEVERLKRELEEKIEQYIERESNATLERQNMLSAVVNENFLLRDDLNIQRALVNGLRDQVQFLLFRNRTRSTGMPTEFLPSSSFEMEPFDTPTRSSSEERLNLKL